MSNIVYKRLPDGTYKKIDFKEVTTGGHLKFVNPFDLIKGRDGESIIGPTGIGIKGEKGDRGEVGPQGPMGPMGEKGDRGEIGQIGATGATGATGPAGKQGPKGDRGPMGPMGPAGKDAPGGSNGLRFITDPITINPGQQQVAWDMFIVDKLTISGGNMTYLFGSQSFTNHALLNVRSDIWVNGILEVSGVVVLG